MPALPNPQTHFPRGQAPLMAGLPCRMLLGEEVKRELEAQERPADALDSEAGAVVGFAGVLVALSLASLHGLLARVGAGFAGPAALCSALAFLPLRTPALALRRLRSTYLSADEEFTRLRLLDIRIAMHEETGNAIERKAEPGDRRSGRPSAPR